MKTSRSLLAAALVALSICAMAEPVSQKPSVDVLSMRQKNLFAFKVARPMKGALVEIFYSNGDLVASRQVHKRRMIIDFCDVKSGAYTIRVTKNGRTEEFHYQRK